MQKAVFQWRPESKSVAFVNVFDDLGAAGKDQFLLEVRQTPKAQPFPEDAGKPFDEVVRIHQAVLDARPAMRAMYFAASNPVLQYGLPTSQVADMGNHYAVRLQRAVIQEWKQDVPWARAGQATVANGGDIAKEAGLFPAPALAASDAGAAATVGAAPAPASGAAPHDGAWGGRTDRNEEITMTVEGNGTVITRLRLTVPTPSSRCAVAYTANFTSTRIPIVGGKARAGSQDGTLEFTATFDSHSSASGTYNFKNFDTSNATYAGTSYNPGSCGSITLAGTWTMRGP
jgi:hypothetical protein